MAISTIQEAIEDIQNGKMVILVDDEDRENEGDLCMAAEFIFAGNNQLHGPLWPWFDMFDSQRRNSG